MWLHKWQEELLTTYCWKKEVLKQWRVQGNAGMTQRPTPLIFRPNWPNWDCPLLPPNLSQGRNERAHPTHLLSEVLDPPLLSSVSGPSSLAPNVCAVKLPDHTSWINKFPVFLISLLPKSITQNPLFFLTVQTHCELIVQEYKPYYLYVVSQLRQPLKIIFPTYTCENDRRSVKYCQRRFTWMVTLLHFVHRQKLLEPANPNFQIDITNARNVYRQHSFRIEMNGTHRTRSDHARLHILFA